MRPFHAEGGRCLSMKYAQSNHVAQIGNKTITVRNLTPVFVSRDEQKDTKDKIEKGLYDIFKKYMP